MSLPKFIWEHHAHSQSVIMCDTIHWCTHTHSYQHVCTRTCLIRTLDRVPSLFLSSPWYKDTLPKVSILERFYRTHTLPSMHTCSNSSMITHMLTLINDHTHILHTQSIVGEFNNPDQEELVCFPFLMTTNTQNVSNSDIHNCMPHTSFFQTQMWNNDNFILL